MKAPDKIFVHRKEKPLEVTWSEVEEKGCVNIEYIRKGALIEWAKEEQELTISLREDAWWDEVINKIKSM